MEPIPVMDVYIHNTVLSYFRTTMVHSMQYQHAGYVIYETQKDSKAAPTFDKTQLTFASEDNRFSEFAFEVQ